MRIAVVSPHRDDAAFSCSLSMTALLQAGADITIVNVFTRSDYAIDFRTVDPCLPQADAVTHARRREDELFAADLAACAGRDPGAVRLYDLAWLDAPLRLGVAAERVLESPLTPVQVQQQATELAMQLAYLSTFSVVFAPLALGDHIDHRVARDSVRLAAPADRLCLYEDLPYAGRLSSQQRKEQAFRAIAWNGQVDFLCYATHVAQGQHLKERFGMHYPSQIAPETAREMAHYAARGSTGGVGRERWWASAEAAAVIAGSLQSASIPCKVVQELQ